MAVEDDGVPGIVASGIPRDVIKRRGHIVDDLAFSSSPHCAPTTTTAFVAGFSICQATPSHLRPHNPRQSHT